MNNDCSASNYHNDGDADSHLDIFLEQEGLISEPVVPEPERDEHQQQEENSSSSGGRKKRRKVKSTLEEFLVHFRRLNSLHVNDDGTTQSGVYESICKYCEDNYNSRMKTIKKDPNLMYDKKKTKKAIESVPIVVRGRFTRRDMERHLKKCKVYNGIQEDSIFLKRKREQPISTSLPSTPNTTTSLSNISVLSEPKRSEDIRNYGVPPLSEQEVEKMNLYLVELMIDAGLPFSFVDMPSFHRLVDSIRHNASKKLPYRQKVSSHLLPQAAKKALEFMDVKIKELLNAGHYGGLLIDGYKNVSGVHIESMMLAVNSTSYPLDIELSGSDHHGIAVASAIEKQINNNTAKYRIRYVCTDDAGQCGRARRILSLRHPHIVFMRCYAHQLNLMVGALLKLSDFKEVGNIAISAAKGIKVSSAKYLPKLVETCNRVYGKSHSYNIFIPAETRWNSIQQCFAGLLRIKSALKLFSVEYDNASKFPAACKHFTDDSFWTKLAEAELMIRPFCDASYLMQRECNTLAHVMLVSLTLTHFIIASFGSGNDTDESNKLIEDIEKRWKDEEQPLFVLAFLLHPMFRDTAVTMVKNSEKAVGNWSLNRNHLSLARLQQAVVFYYGKYNLFHVKEEEERKTSLCHLRRQLKMWFNGKLSVDEYMADETENVVEWWIGHETEYTEISRLASFLLGVKVQSASCERYFKDYARFHTKVRNSLDVEKSHNSVVVLNDIHRKYRINKGSGKKSRNRKVKADEYDRIDAEGRSDNNSDSDCDSSDSDSAGEMEENERSNVSDLDHFLAALSLFDPDDDDSNDDQEADHTNAVDDIDDRDEDEDPYETIPSPLEELPDANVSDYPQENRHYFSKKKYVRTDKYLLKDMLRMSLVLPSVKSAFQY